MPKVVLDPGHGGYDPGAVGPDGLREKDITLKIGLALKQLLLINGFEVGMTRETDTSPGGSTDLNTELNERVRISEAFMGANGLFLSLHLNSIGGNPQVDGTETLIYADGGNAGKAARIIQDELVAVTGVSNRGVKVQNVLVLRKTTAPAVLTESVFISSQAEAARLVDSNFINALATAHAKGVCRYFGIPFKIAAGGGGQPAPQPEPAAKNLITGKSELDAHTMDSFVLKTNPAYTLKLAQLYLDIGAKYGIRGDVAFAQAIKETGYFRFGGIVPADANNFSGLGATGGGAQGARFSTPAEGIEAQMQHLFAYATKDALPYPQVDPRFQLVTRGIAPNWEDLNGHWAVPGNNYGQEIIQLYQQMKAYVAPTPTVTTAPPPPTTTSPTATAKPTIAPQPTKPITTAAPVTPAPGQPSPGTDTPPTEAPTKPSTSFWDSIINFFRNLFKSLFG